MSPREWKVPADASQLARLRAGVVAYAAEAGMTGQRLEELRLAVSEAATNAISHAFPDRAPGNVRVQSQVVDDELVVSVSDDGEGMTARRQRPRLGRGLRLISTLADSVETRTRSGQGTMLRMRFDLTRRRNGAAAEPPRSPEPPAPR